MTPEQHQREHVRLHKALDELLACYFSSKTHGLLRSAGTSDRLIDLMAWSHQKAMIPTPVPEDAHDPRTKAEFEAERQMILLALAELALSRPGFEDSIRQIARHYDEDGLPVFESFKTSNADRVKAERSAL